MAHVIFSEISASNAIETGSSLFLNYLDNRSPLFEILLLFRVLLLRVDLDSQFLDQCHAPFTVIRIMYFN